MKSLAKLDGTIILSTVADADPASSHPIAEIILPEFGPSQGTITRNNTYIYTLNSSFITGTETWQRCLL